MRKNNMYIDEEYDCCQHVIRDRLPDGKVDEVYCEKEGSKRVILSYQALDENGNRIRPKVEVFLCPEHFAGFARHAAKHRRDNRARRRRLEA